jgi:hypothetical protein
MLHDCAVCSLAECRHESTCNKLVSELRSAPTYSDHKFGRRSPQNKWDLTILLSCMHRFVHQHLPHDVGHESCH